MSVSPNGKRATALQHSLVDRRKSNDPFGDWVLLRDALDAAERRGEERVLRFLVKALNAEIARSYQIARRARRGGKR